MMAKMTEKEMEKFVAKRGYDKYKGFKIDTSELEDGILYLTKSNMKDMFEPCVFWMHTDSEAAYENLKELVRDIKSDEKYLKHQKIFSFGG
jgi:hypothetical protein